MMRAMHIPGSGRPRTRLAAGLLVAGTLALTLARATRWPNDFAEAHWLLDYRFGFVKRGLAGQVLSTSSGLAGTEPSAAIISAISLALLAALCAILLWTASQLVHGSAQPRAALLVTLAFMSSPFVIMSAHLIGYYDGLLIMLTASAVVLMVRGRPWAAAAVQAVAILVHESAVLVGFPVLCLAWWVTAGHDGPRGARLKRATPLLVPVAAFVAVALSARALPADFQDRYSEHLARHAFVEGDMHIFVPEWLTPGFAQHFAEQKHRFVERVTNGELNRLVQPTVLALLWWTIAACRVRLKSVTMLLLVGATFAPQLMHVAAWDTVRIWTYSAAMAWLAAWTLVRARGAHGSVSTGIRLIALLAVVANAVTATPLLDYLADRYSLTARLVLYTPVLLAAAILFLTRDRPMPR